MNSESLSDSSLARVPFLLCLLTAQSRRNSAANKVRRRIRISVGIGSINVTRRRQTQRSISGTTLVPLDSGHLMRSDLAQMPTSRTTNLSLETLGPITFHR